uniref:BUB1 N-terminal domain-containing protein n=1 Tax=Leersia perrieri TaxID=77586 RepID=A0A0D9XWF7_9ORYZ
MAAAEQPCSRSAGGGEEEKDLLSAVVGDIRSYSGSDPLRPWLRGMRKLEAALPPAMQRAKLPRFLQKCAQEFQDDARYRDDPRYLRVWIQLMDYVKDAKPLLKKMEKNRIGLKRAAFYMAYALYYEKHKMFEDAEKMYCLGTHNLAEPIGELQKAHEQFIHRMELYKRRKQRVQQERMANNVKSIATSTNQVEGQSRSCTELKSNPVQRSGNGCNPHLGFQHPLGRTLSRGTSGDTKSLSRHNSDDTVVVRFVGSALVGKSETEDACHHGLVEPTINTKEAMDAISSMFLEPLEPETKLKRRSNRDKPRFDKEPSAFEIFVDEDEPNRSDPSILQHNMKQENPKLSQQASTFEIFVDEDDPNYNNQKIAQHKNVSKENTKVNQKASGFEIFIDENEPHGNGGNTMCHKSTRCPPKPFSDSRQRANFDFQKPFVGGFAILHDDEDEQFEENDNGVKINSGTVQLSRDKGTPQYSRQSGDSHPAISGLREDTVVHRFVGSAVVGEPKVENACHHGLIEPTVNLKEAMDDINSMFGRPLNFKGDRPKNKKTTALSEKKAAPPSGFSILADDDPEENPAAQVKQSDSCKSECQSDLFEPTITTRDVMTEINDMFGMPLDF